MAQQFRLENVFSDKNSSLIEPQVLGTVKIDSILSEAYGCTADCGVDGQQCGCRLQKSREYN